MDPKELEQMLAKAAKDAADAVVKAQADAKAAEAAKAAEEAAFNARVASVVKSQESGAERLLADIEKRFAEQTESTKSTIAGLEAAIKEKAAELEAIQKSKMSFSDKQSQQEGSTYADREKAVLLSKIMGKSIESTKYGRDLVEKAGAHVPNATWELEVSRNMENEIRRRLVIVPNFRALDMATNVMKIPVNPEAGLATWVANTSFGTTASPGAAQTHQLKEITLSAYKLATMEYLAYEEEEDALLVLLPIIRDAMIRRVARGMDKAYLYDANSPFTGVAAYDTTSVATVTNTGTVTTADLRKLRKDLGAWGLEPSDLRYIVSTETYFDLMEDTVFQTMDKVGPAATVLTGQVGQIGGTPVLVSDAFATRTGGTSSSNTNIGAICVAPANFLAGNQRGLRFDTQDLVETQRKVLVASLRTGLTQFSTANGMGVSTLRHT
jgi:HK97 family phage major capsid protein